jgi:hypothetical protein
VLGGGVAAGPGNPAHQRRDGEVEAGQRGGCVGLRGGGNRGASDPGWSWEAADLDLAGGGGGRGGAYRRRRRSRRRT